MSLVEFLAVGYGPVFWLEVPPPKTNSWNFWRWDFPPQKKSAMSSFSVKSSQFYVKQPLTVYTGH